MLISFLSLLWMFSFGGLTCPSSGQSFLAISSSGTSKVPVCVSAFCTGDFPPFDDAIPYTEEGLPSGSAVGSGTTEFVEMLSQNDFPASTSFSSLAGSSGELRLDFLCLTTQQMPRHQPRISAKIMRGMQRLQSVDSSVTYTKGTKSAVAFSSDSRLCVRLSVELLPRSVGPHVG